MSVITIPFQHSFDFEYETIQRLSPLIRRIVAHNPNFFTFYGTNTYIIGNGEVALIDPGPDSHEHIEAIRTGLKGETITHIFITHTHYDHWPASDAIRSFSSGAVTHGYYPQNSNRSNPAWQSPEERSLKTQERFEITGFIPDIPLARGDLIRGRDWTLESVFTPGHASDHMCYHLQEEQVLFSGDHVMGWSTSVISPPSGNMKQYMESLALLLERDDQTFWPAHGPAIHDPKPFVEAFIAHRKEREAQILDQLRRGIDTIPEMVARIYADVPQHLHPAAERSTLAAISYLIERGVVSCSGMPSPHARYELARPSDK